MIALIIFLILQIIPSLFFVIAGFVHPYSELKKGDTILNYFAHLQIMPFVLGWCAFLVPIINWVIVINIIKDEFKETIDEVWCYVCDFFSELLLALKLLIIWLFGLKFICRFLKKILSIPIK